VNPPEDQNPWELLGLKPGASPEQVRRAYERLSVSLAPGSLALYSLAEIEEQRALQRQLRAAYVVLMRSFGVEVGMPAETATPAAPGTAELRPVPGANVAMAVASADSAASDPSTEFTGAALRKARESLGLTLVEVSQRTRIRPQQLESIEAENFDRLPERVFVRGFVMSYARELQLDPERVWASYGKRWEAAAARRA
jgi:flagellar biosynthesis protein FlhG